jgi:hypothetical protein
VDPLLGVDYFGQAHAPLAQVRASWGLDSGSGPASP